MKTTTTKEKPDALKELTFRSYVHNRMQFPEVAPERWAAIFSNAPEMEERFVSTFVLKLMEAADDMGEIGHA